MCAGNMCKRLKLCGTRMTCGSIPSGERCVNCVANLLLMGVIRLKLILKGQDLLISLIQPACQRYHDVPLLQQQLLVSVYLLAVHTQMSSKKCKTNIGKTWCSSSPAAAASISPVHLTRGMTPVKQACKGCEAKCTRMLDLSTTAVAAAC